MIFLHVHIILVLTCASSKENAQLYVAYIKMIKCPSNRLMIRFLRFLMCRSHAFFFLQIAQVSINVICACMNYFKNF
jgi:hypothetical protein